MVLESKLTIEGASIAGYIEFMEGETNQTFRRLPKPALIGCLLVAVAVFLFGFEPIWDNPFDIDRAIGWSYAVVPAMVLMAYMLYWRWSWLGFGLDLLWVLAAKFVVTGMLALAALIWVGPPERDEGATQREPEVGEQAVVWQEPPPQTVLEPGQLGTIEGKVTQNGVSVVGALVYIESGLENFVFSPPSNSVELVVTDEVVIPSFAVVQAYQGFKIHSHDSSLHTLLGRAESGKPIFNLPLVAKGMLGPIQLIRKRGRISLWCTVHEKQLGSLLILHHGFWTKTDADGRFSFRKVPAAELQLLISTPSGDLKRQLVVQAGKVNRVAVH